MADNLTERHLRYIDRYLIPEIVSKLDDETLDEHETKHLGGLDGFMSALYNITLKTKTSTGHRERLLIAKLMKGAVSFRESSKSYKQFANEVFIYAKLLPEFQQVLKDASITNISTDQWVAPCYIAKFGYIEGLSASRTEREAVLVLENLQPQGFTLGPRLYLTRDQLLAMSAILGQYHALSYALRVRNIDQLECLTSAIVPLPFIDDADPSDEKNNLYRAIYRAAFDRIYEFFDRKIYVNTVEKKSEEDLKLIEQMRHIREKYFAEPTRLLEFIRTQVEVSEEDRRFAAILHGDYNRNNVLFKQGQEGEPVDVRMIDFQELRYGSPAIDLSFFMYMNSDESVLENDWMDILGEYHSNMYETLSSVLKSHCDGNEKDLLQVERHLENYNFEKFHAHFKRYAFYGVLVCIHFLPWILGGEEVCARLSHLFETDMHGEEFHKLSVEAGGDEVNFKLLAKLKHASRMGYIDFI